MEYTLFTKALKLLEVESEKTNGECLVAFSGGKDSWVCLDMCMKVFKRVQPFFLFLVPGLKCVQTELDKAEQRYGVKVLEYPHWLLFRCVINEIYCLSHWKVKSGLIKEPTLFETYGAIIAEIGINLIVNGSKAADNLYRKAGLRAKKNLPVVYPLLDWRKFDVLSYLHLNKIMVDVIGASKISGGIDLSTACILWLYDTHRDDFERVEKFFPFIKAVVKRREFYGSQPKAKTKSQR